MSADKIIEGEVVKEGHSFPIDIGGVLKIECLIDATVSFTYSEWYPRGMFGAMEDAEPGSCEVVVDEVHCDVTLYTPGLNIPIGKFKTTSKEFYLEAFGELEVDDVLDLVV